MTRAQSPKKKFIPHSVSSQHPETHHRPGTPPSPFGHQSRRHHPSLTRTTFTASYTHIHKPTLLRILLVSSCVQVRFRKQERTSRETSSLWRDAFVDPQTANSSCRSALSLHSSRVDRLFFSSEEDNCAMLLVVMRSIRWVVMDGRCELNE